MERGHVFISRRIQLPKCAKYFTVPPAGKASLSLISDCLDGMPPGWTIGISPNAGLANTVLGQAIGTLAKGGLPTVHSGQGCRYRWPGWAKRMEDAGLTRSMPKKGCPPDDSACEGGFSAG